ncbi:aminotransferase class III-fold pyridoxal phosphate-dependent enzyme [Streptomyces sp. NPDC056190]|uniref:aminotransferase class III-fold pyridoxal phosphate-dependent enzyme n=1 Tax=Streptomyces sp. NPDC056190 TaxID=3345741 RepID=UPI0035D5D5A0
MVADEIQSGLAGTGRAFACDHEDVHPDIYILGKALGGGLYPVSAIAADVEVMKVITRARMARPSAATPVAAALGTAVVGLLRTGEFQERAQRLGKQIEQGVKPLIGDGVSAVRVRGAWASVDLEPALMSGREMCERLLKRGVLAKDTHGATVRFAPPLVADDDDAELLVNAVRDIVRAG